VIAIGLRAVIQFASDVRLAKKLVQQHVQAIGGRAHALQLIILLQFERERRRGDALAPVGLVARHRARWVGLAHRGSEASER
jgi:hypothetical protein